MIQNIRHFVLCFIFVIGIFFLNFQEGLAADTCIGIKGSYTSATGECKTQAECDTASGKRWEDDVQKCDSKKNLKCCYTPKVQSCTAKDLQVNKEYSGSCQTRTTSCESGFTLFQNEDGKTTISGCEQTDFCCVSKDTSLSCGTNSEGTCKSACASDGTEESVSSGDSHCRYLSAATSKCCKSKSSSGDGEDSGEGGSSSCTGTSGLVPCGRSCDVSGTDVDESQTCTLCHLFWGIKNIMTFAMKVITFIAFLCLVIAAIIYIVSAGNDGLMTTAKTFIKNILAGFVIVLLAWLLVNVAIDYLGVQAFKSKGWTWNNPQCSTSSSNGTQSTTTTSTDDTSSSSTDSTSPNWTRNGSGIVPSTTSTAETKTNQ